MSARTVADISDADLLRRAVGICAAKARRQKRVAWSVVSATFGLGSTFSTQLCRGDALASVVLAGAAMPDDLREMADRLGVGHVMWQVWLAAYQAGWRAAAAGICPKAVNGIDGLVLEMPGIDPR